MTARPAARPGQRRARTAGRPGAGSLALVAVLAALGLVLSGCANRPDTALHPQPTPSYTPERHPFRGATLSPDPDSAAARWRRANGATWLDPITSRPQARWINSPQDLAGVPALATRAARQGTLPVLVAYDLPNRGCENFRDGAPDAARYDRFIGQLIADLGATHAVIILEPDAVAADCFDAARAALLTRTVRRLAQAGQYVYLEAGHSRWRSTGEMATRLVASGIRYAEGFAVNVANRQTTDDSYRWGRELSDLVGGREFVIDTSRNGDGPPPDDPSRDDEWCNPARQALGTPPTPVTDRPGLAALLWIKDPGESDGICGGEHTYLFSPTQARNLIVNATWLPAAQRQRARAVHPAPAGDS